MKNQHYDENNNYHLLSNFKNSRRVDKQDIYSLNRLFRY